MFILTLKSCCEEADKNGKILIDANAEDSQISFYFYLFTHEGAGKKPEKTMIKFCPYCGKELEPHIRETA